MTYPPERIPKQPVLSLQTFSLSSGDAIPCVLDAGQIRYVSRGCMALALALQHARLRNQDEVLLPAYHCISMVEPVIWCGAKPKFYRVDSHAHVDFSDIEAQLTQNTKVLLAAHYFGFPQDMPRIRRFCDAHGLLLIEDCAHAFFGQIDRAAIGSFGDYAIASAWKFFPVIDGGLLVSARKDISDVSLRMPGPRYQAKMFINVLEQAFDFQRLPYARMVLKGGLQLKDALLRQARCAEPAKVNVVADASTGFGNWGFEPALVKTKMSMISWGITQLASKTRVTAARRRNYVKLLKDLVDEPGCKPLYPTLGDDVVPHVFPLLIDDPEPVFKLLKHQGVPIIRFGEFLWPQMPLGRCPVSVEFSRRVFQFPCHQDLLPEDLEWMIGRIRDALRSCRAMKASRPNNDVTLH